MFPRLILASSSPYRRLLLERLQVPFSTLAPEVDESPEDGESPAATAMRLAEVKARAVASRHPGVVVIGSDQVAVMGRERLGKPGSHDAALAQLLATRGGAVVFHTACCVIGGATADQVQRANVPTTVFYRNYTEAEARRYLELDAPYDCAGSAKIESLGIALVERVESTDPTALIGLPLIALVDMLRRAGLPLLA